MKIIKKLQCLKRIPYLNVRYIYGLLAEIQYYCFWAKMAFKGNVSMTLTEK